MDLKGAAAFQLNSYPAISSFVVLSFFGIDRCFREGSPGVAVLLNSSLLKSRDGIPPPPRPPIAITIDILHPWAIFFSWDLKKRIIRKQDCRPASWGVAEAELQK